MASPADERRSAEDPSPGAFLALCRSAGAADRRGAGVARSGSARGALWRAPAAVLDHARVSAARGSGLHARARPGARLRGGPRTRPRRRAPLPRAVLVERGGEAARSLPDCRSIRCHGSAHRRPARSVRARALAPARLVPDSPVDHVSKTTLQQDLTQLETELKQLEAEYNMYF